MLLYYNTSGWVANIANIEPAFHYWGISRTWRYIRFVSRSWYWQSVWQLIQT